MNRTPQLGSGGLSAKLEQLWGAIRRLNPVSNEYIRAEQSTTGGVTLKPTPALISAMKSAGGIQEFEISTTGPRELTAVNGATITKPAKLKSLSDTRDEVGQTENWKPEHTTVATRPATPSFNYANEHYRWRIIHKTTGLANNTLVDYLKILERIEPKYEVGDAIYAAKFGGDWIDLNADGRRWATVYQWDPTQYLIGPVEGNFSEEHSRPWALASQQDDSQQYGGTASWLSTTDFTASDIY